MPRRNHPNKDKSGLWLPKSGDNFDKETLLEFKKFFENDLIQARADQAEQLRLANPKLTPSKKNKRTDGKDAENAIEVSKKNIAKVKEFLAKFK